MPARMIIAMLVVLLISIPAFAQAVNLEQPEVALNPQSEALSSSNLNQSHKPLDQIQVLGFLAGKVYSTYLAMLVEQRGIEFEPTDDFLQILLAAGAEEGLLDAVRSANPTFTSAATSAPSPSDAAVLQYVARGAELGYKGLYPQAELEFRAALQLDQENAALHLALGTALLFQQRGNDAINEVQESVRLAPNEAELHQKLSVLLSVLEQDIERTITEQREAVRLEPEYVERHFNLGALFERKADYDASLSAYREALRLQPDLIDLHYNIGVALKGKGDLDGAIQEYREELRLHPDHFSAHYNLGLLLHERRVFGGAIRQFRESLRIRPDNEQARLQLASSLAGAGDLRGALAELLKVPRVVALLFFLVLLVVAVAVLAYVFIRFIRRRRRSRVPEGANPT